VRKDDLGETEVSKFDCVAFPEEDWKILSVSVPEWTMENKVVPFSGFRSR